MKYDFRARSDASMLMNDEPSLTKQEFKASCDLNNILKKYVRNGVNPFVVTADAKFGDFTNVPSYADALNLVISASDHFNALPAVVRKRFGNDPAEMLNFLSDPRNVEEAVKLGLIQSVQKMVTDEPKKNSPAEPVNGGEAPGKS